MRIHLIETGRHHVMHLGSTAWSAGAHAALAAGVAAGAYAARAPRPAPPPPETEVVYLLPTLPTAPAPDAQTRAPTPPHGASGLPAQANGTRPAGRTRRDGEPVDRPTAAALAAIDSLARRGSLIFRVSDIDRPVERDPYSAAPAYPAELQRGRIEGDVAAEWIVDASGRADTTTFNIVSASHPGFAAAVRAALPLMHFRPAELHGRRVRQMVRQNFSFRLIYDPARDRAARDTSASVAVRTP